MGGSLHNCIKITLCNHTSYIHFFIIGYFSSYFKILDAWVINNPCKKKFNALPSSQNEIFPYPLNISFSLFPLLKARPVPARPPSGRKARYKRGSKKRINFIFPYRFFFQTRKKKWNNFRTFWTMNFYCNFVQFMLRKKNLKSKKRI